VQSLIETQALLTLPIVRAFAARATTTPSADFCNAVRTPLDALSHEFVTHSRSPAISSTAGFTTSALDGYGLPDCLLARPAP
jgi:hypothetical protein